jgi:hypothetical protein
MTIMGHITFLLLSVKSPTSGKLMVEKLESVKCVRMRIMHHYYLRNEYPQMFGNNPVGYFFPGRQSLTIFAKKKQKKKKRYRG